MTALQVELPLSLFEGLSVSDILQKTLNLARLVTYAERLVVQDFDGRVILHSPDSLNPSVPTALLTVRWPSVRLEPTVGGFWELAMKGYEAIMLADEVLLTLPDSRVVVLKSRRAYRTIDTEVPVPAQQRPT